MRSTLLCCALLVQLSAFSHAQDLNQIIAPSQRAHDFGTVARAANTEHRFELFNPFSSEMEISGVRASCGCTTPIVETQRIPPGQRGSLLARFNTGTHTGQKGATVTVTISRPIFTELQLTVKGYIRSDVVLSPGEVAFGTVAEGEPRSMELLLNYVGRSDWSITELTSPLDDVKASYQELSRHNGKVSYKIKVDLTENAPAGFIQSQLVLHTNDRRLTTLPIRLLASVEPDLQVSPQGLALGRIKPGQPIQQRLVIKGREPFRVLDISSDSAEIQYEQDETSRKAHLINIIVAPHSAAEGGAVEGQLRLKTDMRDEPLMLKLNYTLEEPSVKPSADIQAAN